MTTSRNLHVTIEADTSRYTDAIYRLTGEYPRRPTGCPECDTQDVPLPCVRDQELRDLHRALHDLGRQLHRPACWLLRKFGGFA